MVEMRHGNSLWAGLGWTATLGGLALCVLIFLSAYLAFDDHRHGATPRKEGVVRLLFVPDAEVGLAGPLPTDTPRGSTGAAVDALIPPPSPRRRSRAAASAARGPGARRRAARSGDGRRGRR